MKLHRVLISGLVMLLVGIVLVVGAAIATIGPVIASGHGFSGVSPGEYASSNISLNQDDVLFVINSTSSTYVIPSADLHDVSATNISNYSEETVPGNTTDVGGTTYQAGSNTTLYGNLSGTYRIVVFSSRTPQMSFSVDSPFTTLPVATIGLIGVPLVFIGVPTTIIGAVLHFRGRRMEGKIDDLMERYGK